MPKWKVVTDSDSESSPPSEQKKWKVVEPSENQEEESFFSKLPRNIVAGLAQGGHKLINTPYDIGKNIEQQGENFGQFINKALPLEKYGIENPQSNFSATQYIPHQQEYDFAKLLGQKGNPTTLDTLIQKGAEYGPELLLGANALRTSGLLPHLTRRGASRTLNQARQLGVERNMGSLNVTPELIEDLRQFLPNTAPYRNALEAAHTGEYQPLFNLQSDVGKHSADYARSLFSAAERAHGRTGLAARNALLQDMHRALKEEGHLDISNLLRQGQEEYRRYMNFKPYRNAALISAAGLAVPKNPLTNLLGKIIMHKNE